MPADDTRSLTAQEKGGLARRDALAPEERTSIAKRAAAARWAIPVATHAGVLTIGDLTIPCSVLEDGTRVLSEGGLTKALGRARSGSPWLPGADPGARMPHFAPPKSLISFLGDELANELSRPIKYRAPKGGKVAYGVKAELIPGVCEAWLDARDADALNAAQKRTAAKAGIIMRGLARVGIIALVDEATGYQEVRDRLALQRILDAYLRREFAAWAKRFPDEFYRELFRLKGWTWPTPKGRGPRVVAAYTNDFVYARLAPGILEELRTRNPVDDSGRRRSKHHQWLTTDVGHPALAQHLHAVMGLMRASLTWDQFKAAVDRAFPPRTDLSDLPLFNPPSTT